MIIKRMGRAEITQIGAWREKYTERRRWGAATYNEEDEENGNGAARKRITQIMPHESDNEPKRTRNMKIDRYRHIER